jgi:hypothetical protein
MGFIPMGRSPQLCGRPSRIWGGMRTIPRSLRGEIFTDPCMESIDGINDLARSPAPAS